MENRQKENEKRKRAKRTSKEKTWRTKRLNKKRKWKGEKKYDLGEKNWELEKGKLNNKKGN